MILIDRNWPKKAKNGQNSTSLEPYQVAYQMKAKDEENSNIVKKLAEIGPNWPKLAKKGKKWPKFDLIRAIPSCTSNES